MSSSLRDSGDFCGLDLTWEPVDGMTGRFRGNPWPALNKRQRVEGAESYSLFGGKSSLNFPIFGSCETSRRDSAIVAWHEVPGTAPPQRGRPVGYGLIRAGVRTIRRLKHGAHFEEKYLWD